MSARPDELTTAGWIFFVWLQGHAACLHIRSGTCWTLPLQMSFIAVKHFVCNIFNAFLLSFFFLIVPESKVDSSLHLWSIACTSTYECILISKMHTSLCHLWVCLHAILSTTCNEKCLICCYKYFLKGIFSVSLFCRPCIILLFPSLQSRFNKVDKLKFWTYQAGLKWLKKHILMKGSLVEDRSRTINLHELCWSCCI